MEKKQLIIAGDDIVINFDAVKYLEKHGERTLVVFNNSSTIIVNIKFSDIASKIIAVNG